MLPDQNISPQLILDLILALRDAGSDYAEILQHQDVGQMDVIMEQLPVYIGKFLSSLDLLDEFIRIGRMIRDFEDAYQVMIALNKIVNDKLESDQAQLRETRRYMELLFALCDETARINAAFTLVPKMTYPEDSLPGHTFSDN